MSKTEYEKMLAQEWYNPADYELSCLRVKASRLVCRYNQTDALADKERREILEELCGKIGNEVFITPPFHCDYGCHLEIEDRVYMNAGCTILDCHTVHIGEGTLFGPNVQIYGVNHPLTPVERASGIERSKPVVIGKNVWIGGGCVVLADSIGDNSVIGAGSVVTKNIPEGVLAVGNPCQVIRKIA